MIERDEIIRALDGLITTARRAEQLERENAELRRERDEYQQLAEKLGTFWEMARDDKMDALTIKMAISEHLLLAAKSPRALIDEALFRIHGEFVKALKRRGLTT